MTRITYKARAVIVVVVSAMRLYKDGLCPTELDVDIAQDVAYTRNHFRSFVSGIGGGIPTHSHRSYYCQLDKVSWRFYILQRSNSLCS